MREITKKDALRIAMIYRGICISKILRHGESDDPKVMAELLLRKRFWDTCVAALRAQIRHEAGTERLLATVRAEREKKEARANV